jgi:hypothetical protein
MRHLLVTTVIFFVLVFPPLSQAQSGPAPQLIPNTNFTTDYPSDHPGILVQQVSWKEIQNEMPAKTKAKHGIAASLSYGAVPAKVVAEYEGEHSAMQLGPGQITICICHMLSLPGEPVIVRLHSKKNSRELDGGKMIVYPVVGGSKTADANKSDLIPVDVAHPDPHVWLVRSQSSLAAGEYALMLGTQNVNIYPFSIATESGTPRSVTAEKK